MREWDWILGRWPHGWRGPKKVAATAFSGGRTMAGSSSAPTPDLLLRILDGQGWRVLEQRLPWRAYVVVASPSAYRHGRQEAVSRFGAGGSSTTLELKATPR